jgi:hypothetical protein
MNIASAYPNSDLSAGALTVIALVMAACLTVWIVLVFLAERSNERDSRQAHSRHTVVAQPDQAAEDEHSEAGAAPVGHRHEAAA